MPTQVARVSDAVQGKLAALVAARPWTAPSSRAVWHLPLRCRAAPRLSTNQDIRVKQAGAEPTMRRMLAHPFSDGLRSDSRLRVRASSRRIKTMRRRSTERRPAHTRLINRRKAELGLCLIHSSKDQATED
jgi:hypothetical protein